MVSMNGWFIHKGRLYHRHDPGGWSSQIWPTARDEWELKWEGREYPKEAVCHKCGLVAPARIFAVVKLIRKQDVPNYGWSVVDTRLRFQRLDWFPPEEEDGEDP